MDKTLWQRQMSIGEILSEGFRLIRINLVPILLLVIYTHAPLNLLRTALSSYVPVEEYGDTSVSLLALAIKWLDYFLNLVVIIGVAYIVEKSLHGESVRVRDVFRFSSSRLSHVFWTGLLLSLVTLGLTLLLIVPGIIWGNYYSFAITIAALRDMKGKTAFEYSKKLVQGQWWRVFGVHTTICLPAITFNLLMLMLSKQVSNIKLLYVFAPLTIFNIVGAIVLVMAVVFFLNTESVRDFERQSRRLK